MEDARKELIKEMLRKDRIEENMMNIPTLKDLKEIEKTIRKPKNEFEDLLVEFYNILDNATSPDEFDKWYENVISQKHRRVINRFKRFLEEIADYLKLVVESTGSEEQWFQGIFFKITERKLEENLETMGYIMNKINSLANGELVGVQIEIPDFQTIKDQTIALVENEINKIDLDSYTRTIKDIEKRIDNIKETNLDKISHKLNNVLDIGKDLWSLQILATLSPFAPPLVINGVQQRKTLHSLVIGDIASGKSTMLRILEKISPKAKPFSKITEASMEGIATKDGIENGLFDNSNPHNINNGSLLISEFDKFRAMPILKEIMDNGKLTFVKKGQEGTVTINTSMICCANPKNDFFLEELNLRSQISEKESILSRFDICVPMANTSKKIETIMDDMVLFGYKQVEELDERILKDIAQLMQKVKFVKITPEQQKTIIKVMKTQSCEIKNRPLILLRDIETFARILNTLSVFNACVNNPENIKEIVEVTDEDIEHTIKLWEYLIDLRKTLYLKSSRNIIDVKQKIMLEIIQNPEINIAELQKDFENRKICSRATFYRKIKDLILEERITKEGKLLKEVC